MYLPLAASKNINKSHFSFFVKGRQVDPSPCTGWQMAYILEGRKALRQWVWRSNLCSRENTSWWPQRRQEEVRDQVDSESELLCRFAIKLKDADAFFPAFEGCQGGMKAYKEVYDNQEDMQLDEILVQAFSKDLESFGLSTSHNKLQT